jgi:hypothetical protein
MAGLLSQIITAISDDVKASMATAGYPPLVDGKILVGTAAVHQQSAGPRIVFEPIGSAFSVRAPQSASAVLSTDERSKQHGLRAIATEAIFFDVHCWGQSADSGDPVDDYDLARAMYHAVRSSLHKKAPGAYNIDESGKWTNMTEVMMSGQEFVFRITLLTPVLESLLPYDRARLFAPDTVHPDAGLTFEVNGVGETAC